MNSIQICLWWCAGARIDLLKQDNFRDDRAKYFGIGGTILFTALMASFAGGYAFFTAFKEVNGVEKYLGIGGKEVMRETYTNGSYISAILFGIFWGALIFNLDRYIVSTIKDDGKPTISRTEFFNALPRLVLALILGLVISLPVELKIYEKEINVEIHNIISEKQAELALADSSKINEKLKLEAEVRSLNTEIDLINNGGAATIQSAKVNDLAAKIPDLQADLKDAKDKEGKENEKYKNKLNNCIRMKKSQNLDLTPDQIKKSCTNNVNKSALNAAIENRIKIENELKKLSKSKDLAEADAFKSDSARIGELRSKIRALEDRIIKIQEIIDNHQAVYEDVANQYTGFMASCLAFERLRTKEMDVLIKSLFITFLFIFIEIAPVLFKLMTESGNYDTAIKTNRILFVDECDSKIAEFNDTKKTDGIISSEKNKTRLDAELKGNQDLLNAISLAQSEIAVKAVNKWKKKELSRLESSIEHIIKSNETTEISFQNKFWNKVDDGLEYYFRDGKRKDLIIKNMADSKIGKWNLIGNEIEIEIEGVIKFYTIAQLTNEVFEIHHKESAEQLKFQLA